MNEFFYFLFQIAFQSLAVVLLVMRFYWSQRISWRMIAILVLFLGWVLVNLTVYFYYEHLSDMLMAASEPLPEMLERYSSDSAKRTFAVKFGWLYSFFYFLPFLSVFGLIRWFIDRGRNRNA